MTAVDTVHTVDGDAVEVGTELDTVAPAPVPTGLFGTGDPVEVVQRASTVAAALADVIRTQHMFTSIRGKQHVSIEGWQTLGAMLGVSAVVTHTAEVGGQGSGDWEARAEARTSDGRVVGAADAMCMRAEGGNWGPKASSNARRAMAQTRSMSRALRGPLGFVVTLAGYATTAAEEMPADVPAPPPPPPPVLVGDIERAEILGLLKALHTAGVPGLMQLLVEHGATDSSSFTGAAGSLPASSAAKVIAGLRTMPVPSDNGDVDGDDRWPPGEEPSLYELDAEARS